jgi:hypothetical protein
MKAIFHLFCLVWLLVLLAACSETAQSPEDEIKDFIQSSVEAVENRELDSLKVQDKRSSHNS